MVNLGRSTVNLGKFDSGRRAVFDGVSALYSE